MRTRATEASSSRLILHGFSLGGLFSAYALLARPDAFETVSIMALSLWWNDFAIFQELPAFEDRVRAVGAKPRAVLGVGSTEQQEPTVAPAEATWRT